MDTQTIHVEYGDDALDIPYVEIVGAHDGPSAFISGGMHGNEINGIAIVRRFLEQFNARGLDNQLNGRLVLLPVLNPSGFARMRRRVFEDDQDLNRSFGFDEPESLSQKMATTLAESVFRHCQFGIDLHDAGGRAVLVPHARIHADEDRGCHHNTHKMSQLFGTTLVVERPGKAHMMAIEMYRRYELPVLTVEIGGAQRLYEEYFDTAIDGLMNILAAYGMIERDIQLPERQFLLDDRYGVAVSQACQVRFQVRLGDRVHAGDELGELYFPQRNVCETIHSPMCGYVFSLWGSHQAYEGATIYSILEDEDCHVDRSTLSHFKLLPALEARRIEM